VAFILAAFFLRNSTGAIIGSLFVVYLNETGFSGTLIGALVAFSELSGVAGSLLAARAERRVGRARLIILCIAISVVCICTTPADRRVSARCWPARACCAARCRA
jgi:MFS family permease